MRKIEVFDSSLRDGAQGCGISYSVADKLNILKALDEFGVDYIEAGNPSSNQKDVEFFQKATEYKMKNSKLVAFGATKRKGIKPEEDSNLNALVASGADYISIFGKSSKLHVEEIIKTTLQENLDMIFDTVSYLVGLGKTVFYDAEHFFDGYKLSAEYALDTLKAAARAGASRIVLCDTNGGCFPDEIYEITKKCAEELDVPIGIHCHNDMECAVANSISAVKAGAMQVQGTFIGTGERCGNTNLSAIIPSLQLKLGYECIDPKKMPLLTLTARHIAEISNIVLPDSHAYVGRNAFTHKAGMHVDGVKKNSKSFEHIEPCAVGNERNILVSEVAGRAVIMDKLNKIAPELTKDRPEVGQIIELIKQQEYLGYQYEAAEASFELLVMRFLKKYKPFFHIEYYKIIGEKSEETNMLDSAIVKVKVGDKTEISADEGKGPVNAIDKAIRQALSSFYSQLDEVHLVDYKVRVMDSGAATAATVRVLIETTDGTDVWTTVGASTDIIEASVEALVDSLEYKLVKNIK